MDRRRFVAMIGSALAAPLARAQSSAEKPKRVGLLVQGSRASRGHLDEALVDALREQGYVEGRNLVIERRYADGGGRSRLRELAQELDGLKLDAVVTTCTPSTQSMKEQSSTTPIVMAVVADPVGQQLIASFARPGGNITGTSSQAEDILPKMLEYFASVLPKNASVAVLADRRNPVHGRLWEKTLKTGPAVGLRLTRYEIGSSSEIDGAINAAAREGAVALFALPDHPLFMDQRERIVAAAGRHRLPGFFWAREFVEAGGLMSYGENLAGSWGRASTYVTRIVRGARPGELPVSQPTIFELVINVRTAKSLGIAIPQSLLVRADRVIE
jgi:putative tryptophan/tyrosine transport system substrate-binding protein